ncbi:MAG: hypothetical protein EA339_07895 [Rhodobacteraceae bacterium]|nr:MAG: hypothetical protein EA339_07895 [Paracoccaceae bacterium]
MTQPGAAISDINSVVFFDEDLNEVFTIEGPFDDAQGWLDAFDEAVLAHDMDDVTGFGFVQEDGGATKDDEDEDESTGG